MTRFIGRVLIILLGFLAASLVAAFVVTVAMFMEWQEILESGAGWFLIAVLGLILSAQGLLPALLAIAITEVLRLRSSLFYAAAGGAGLVGLYYALGLGETGLGAGVLVSRELEIMAGAGIAGGFVYWAIAGRRAGAWYEPVRTMGMR